MVCEYDVFEISEKYKRMSLAEIEKEEKQMLKKIIKQEHPKKSERQNKKGIIFNF